MTPQEILEELEKAGNFDACQMEMIACCMANALVWSINNVTIVKEKEDGTFVSRKSFPCQDGVYSLNLEPVKKACEAMYLQYND